MLNWLNCSFCCCKIIFAKKRALLYFRYVACCASLYILLTLSCFRIHSIMVLTSKTHRHRITWKGMGCWLVGWFASFALPHYTLTINARMCMYIRAKLTRTTFSSFTFFVHSFHIKPHARARACASLNNFSRLARRRHRRLSSRISVAHVWCRPAI